MPVIKNALLRYRVIDRAIKNVYLPFPTKETIRQACEEELYGSSHGENICHSTIEKDIFAMRMEHDAPIKYSKKEKGYYYTDPEYSMDDIPLTDSDISAIKAATSILQQFKNTPLFNQFQFAIDKILDRATLSDNSKQNYNENIIQFETLPTIRGNELLDPLLNAIKNRQMVQFGYQSFKNDNSTIRRLHPYLLKEYRNRWYLIGKSEIKDRIVTFGLDRMSDLLTLDMSYVIDPSFSPDVFFKYALGITTYEAHPENVIIQTNKVLSKYLLTQPLHHTQKIIDVNNEIHTFSYYLLPSYELKMQLLGFGEDLKVIQPASLKNDIVNAAKGLIKIYDE